MNSLGILSKFKGSMVGGLLGDCLGKPFEYEHHKRVTEAKDFMFKLLSGEDKNIYQYTDDTAMTLSIVKSLTEKKTLDPKDIAQRFVAEFYKAFEDPEHTVKRSYGAHVIYVFKALKETDFKDIFQPASAQFEGGGSFGNGAAMRISPIALYGNTKDDNFLQDVVEQCSRITHAHTHGYNGAILQCFAVHVALKLDPTKELDLIDFITQLEKKMKIIEQEDDDPYCEKLKKMKEIFQKQENISTNEIVECLGNDVTALGSVPSAIYSFLRGTQPLSDFECSNPFVRTIYFAISLAGDTDTIASMAGSIAGAYYGIEIIPKILQKRCEAIKKIKELAKKMYSLSQTVS